ncbi:MAG: type I restriction endonuclease subunit R, partial [Selenomonadaceae bacterium]|nr:type I restriction endonuclease subunit R [Selenomonadaceae bacterium]
MVITYKESDYERAVMELFGGLGYQTVCAPDLERDFKSPLYDDILEEKIWELNPTLPREAIDNALYKLRNFDNGELVQKNEIFMDYLQSGIEVKYSAEGEERSAIVYVVDYGNLEKNSFIAANQWKFTENSTRRLDIILFLNGLPVVVIELKSPSRE